MDNNLSNDPLLKELERLKRENTTLKELLDVKNAFLENITDIAYITNSSGEVVWVNNAAEKITGKKTKDLIGKSFLPLFREEDQESLIMVYKKTLSGVPMENNLTFTTGITCHFTSLPRFGKDGEVIGTFGIARDMTQRLNAEQELKNSEHRLKKAQAFAQVGNWEYIVATGKVWGSEEAFRIYGIERESEFLPLDKVEQIILEPNHVHQALVDLLQDNIPYDIEFEILPERSDSPLLIHSVAEKICDENGNPIKVMGVIQDITHIKQILTENMDYEKMQSHLMNILNAGVVIHAPDTSIVMANTAACRMLGLSQQGVVYKKATDKAWVFKRNDGTDMPLDEFPVMQVMNTQSTLTGHVVGIHNEQNDHTTWVLVDGIPVKDDSDRIKQVIISFIDITELRDTHKRLDEINQNMRLAADSAQFGIWTYNIKKNRLKWDKWMHSLYEIKPEDLNDGFQVWQLTLHPDDMRRASDEFRRAIETGDRYDSQFRIVRPGGDVKYVRAFGVVSHDKSGDAYKMNGINYDITKTVETELALRKSEDRFRDIADMAGNWIWEIDTQGKYVYSNEKIIEILGYSPDEVVGKMYYFDFFRESDRDSLKKKAYKLFEEKAPFQNIINVCVHKNGSEVILETLGKPIFNVNGQYLGYRGVDWDITDHVHAENALKEEKERAENIIEATHAGTWDWNIKTGNFIINERWAEIIGKQLKDLYPLNDVMVKNTIHRDDIERVESMLNLVFKGDLEYFDIEFRQQHVNGHWVWVNSRGKVIQRFEDGKPIRMYGTHVEISERKITESALINSEYRFKALHNASFGGIAIHDKGLILECNQGLADITGYSYDELIGMNGLFLISDNTRDVVTERIKSGYEHPYEVEGVRKDGTEYSLRIEARNIPYKGKQVRVVEFRDITELKQSEEQRELLQKQLAQAQKMESIGRLAGGVAHDFNNILGVIMGYSDLALLDVSDSSPIFECLEEIQKAALKSKDLVRQLLTFSRKQLQTPQAVQVNDAVPAMLKMLKRLIGEDIELTWIPGNTVPLIMIDPTGLDQVVVNLVVNARDAVADTGSITIQSRLASSDEFIHYGQQMEPGNYTVISVSDNGYGMDVEIIQKVFDPFFSTKEPGKGTGLGLSTVFGIVKQSRGYIFVDSEKGKGSVFTVAFPETNDTEEVVGKQKQHTDIMGKEETILLVEDDISMLALTEIMLNKLNYSVLKASTPTEAVKIFKEHQQKIDGILSDVIMPEMNGKVLIRELRKLKPNVPYLFMSGYTADILSPHGVTQEKEPLIHKPFSLEELGRLIKEIIHSRS